MNALTKQKQLVLYFVVGMLLMGWSVKSYRAAHSAARVVQRALP